jgi:hypothetical protein
MCLTLPPFQIYDDKRLDKMRALITELCTTLKRRIDKIMTLQEESRKIYEALVPNASITNEEMALLQTNFSDLQAVVSSQFLHLSESLNQKVRSRLSVGSRALYHYPSAAFSSRTSTTHGSRRWRPATRTCRRRWTSCRRGATRSRR